MAIGFKHGSSGGGSLGITIVSGTARPSVPKENTIWVNSDSAIVSWVVSSVQPDGALGRFWVKTDTESEMKLSVPSGKNIIVIQLRSVYEYIDDGWVERDAEFYSNGEWSDVKMALWIYENGESTGYSWKCDETMKQTSSGNTADESRVTIGSTNITVANTSTKAYQFTNIFCTDLLGAFIKIDLSGWKRIRIKGNVSGASKSNACVFRVLTEMGDLSTQNNVLSQPLYTGTLDTTVDISTVNSACYLGFTLYDEQTTFVLSELSLE